jgi:hypothetical protein
VGQAIHAGNDRDDLCSPLGSCNHGFEVRPPLSLFDGQPHAVHAYAIDSAGGENTELAQSPGTLTCTPSIPSGVRRHVASQESFDAWGFSSFWDVLTVTSAELSARVQGAAWPEQSKLIQADDGSPEVWLVDGDQRRHVPSAAAFNAWGFSWENVTKLPTAEVDAFAEGPPLRAEPFLIKDSGPAIYMLDDAPPSSGSGGASGSSGSGGSWAGAGAGAGSGAGSGGSTAQTTSTIGEESGCSTRPVRRDDSRLLTLIALGAVSMLARRRRQCKPGR